MSGLAVNDQSKQRRYERKKDQHGRLWGVNIELKSGAPTGRYEFIGHIKHPQWNPKPQFVEPPLLPPQKFIRPVPGDPYSLLIDYEGWIGELRNAEEAYLREARKEGIRIHGTQFDPDAPFTREVLDIIGPRPLDPRLALAAKQGNAWILGKMQGGYAPRPDVRLEQLVPVRGVRTARQRRQDEEDFSEVLTADKAKEPAGKAKEPAGAGA